MAKDLKLDSAGIKQVLKSDKVAALVHSAAESVAAGVRGSKSASDGVVVDDYVTDRAASSVTIRDVRGRIWEVRDGLLSSAAASAGLDVVRRGAGGQYRSSG